MIIFHHQIYRLLYRLLIRLLYFTLLYNNDFFKEKKNNLKNIIKIDVQGYDEVIFQDIPKEVLSQTDILIIEITPLKSKSFDKKRFNDKLACFKKFMNFNYFYFL